LIRRGRRALAAGALIEALNLVNPPARSRLAVGRTRLVSEKARAFAAAPLVRMR